MIEQILKWIGKAVPAPTTKNMNVQVGCHVEEFAEMDPEEFFVLIQRASLEAESILKKAMQEGIIRNNINACQFEWIPIADEPMKVIHTYTKSKDHKFDYIKDFAESLLETNPDELKAIKSRLG